MEYMKYCIKCSFGPHSCSSACCAPQKQSITTRLMYSIILFIVASLCAFCHLQVRNDSQSTFQFSEFTNYTCVSIGLGEKCYKLTGYLGVYRLCFSLFVFHCILALLTIKVDTSKRWRAKIHNGFWVIKLVILFFIYCASNLIPTNDLVTKVWMFTGILGSFLFIVFNQMALIDFSYEKDGLWRAKGEKNCCYRFMLLTLSLILYIGVLAFYAFLWIFYAKYAVCTANRIFIVINFVFSFVLTIISILVPKDRHQIMWLPGAVTSAVVAFLTWTALSSEPPLRVSLSSNWTREEREAFLSVNNVSYWLCRGNFGQSFLRSHIGRELHIYVMILFIVVCAFYSSIRTSMQSERLGIAPSRSRMKLDVIYEEGTYRPELELGLKKKPKDKRLQELQQANREVNLGSIDSLDSEVQAINQAKLERANKGKERPRSCSVFEFEEQRLVSPTDNSVQIEANLRAGTRSRNKSGPPISPQDDVSAIGDRRSKIRRSVLWTSQESLTLPRPMSPVGAHGKKRMKKKGISASTPNISKFAYKDRNKAVSLTDMAPIKRDLHVIHDDWEGCKYSYFWFHLIFALTSLVMMSQITNWYNPEHSHIVRPGESWATVWMKIVSSWVVLALFGYTLVCPWFCIGRNLHRHHYDTYLKNRNEKLMKKSISDVV